MLISNCAVIRWIVTGCAGKSKLPAVKQKWFELDREVLRFFQADRKRGDGLSFFALEGKIEQRIRI